MTIADRQESRTIAEEIPVALVFNGVSHAVMLGTPIDLEDFAVGFALSEGIVRSASDIRDIEVTPGRKGICVDLTIAAADFAALKERRRNLAGRTGCGLCGTESLDHVFRGAPRVQQGFALDPVVFEHALAALGERQPLHAFTGALHAAAWVDAHGRIALAREDVGRHNALDKLIGAMTNAGTDINAGFVIITSRASSEIVYKAAVCGIQLVAAISAPTSLAVRIAEHAGVTLVGFVRGSRHTVYANAGRVYANAD